MGIRDRRRHGTGTSPPETGALWRELIVRPGTHRLVVLQVPPGGPRRGRLATEISRHLARADLVTRTGRGEAWVLLCEASDRTAERFIARIAEAWAAQGGGPVTARMSPVDLQTPEPRFERLPATVG